MTSKSIILTSAEQACHTHKGTVSPNLKNERILFTFGAYHPFCYSLQRETPNLISVALHCFKWTALVAQTVKRLSTIRETWVRSLSREDSLEKEMATHSSTLENPMDGGAWCPWGHKELDVNERLHFTFTASKPHTLISGNSSLKAAGPDSNSAYCLWPDAECLWIHFLSQNPTSIPVWPS